MNTFCDRTGKTYPQDHLTPADCENLVSQFGRGITAVRNRALIMVMWRSGLRHAEALALKPKDVDLDNRKIRVLHGKGDKPRTVGMDSHTRAVLELWLSRREEKGIPRCKALFCSISKGMLGAEMDQAYVRRMIKKAADRAGIDKRVTPHGFRHAFATELLLEGVDIKAIQQALGHSTLMATDKYFSTLGDNLGINAVQNRG